MKELHLTIVSPESTVFDGAVDSATFPGKLGRFEVLPGHAPLVSILQAGDIRYSIGADVRTLIVTGGFVEVGRGEVSVCVEL